MPSHTPLHTATFTFTVRRNDPKFQLHNKQDSDAKDADCVETDPTNERIIVTHATETFPLAKFASSYSAPTENEEKDEGKFVTFDEDSNAMTTSALLVPHHVKPSTDEGKILHYLRHAEVSIV